MEGHLMSRCLLSILIGASFLTVPSSSFSHYGHHCHGHSYYRSCSGYPHYSGYPRYYSHYHGSSCSPQVIETNLQAVDLTATNFLSKPENEKNATLKTILTPLVHENDVKTKIDGYKKLINVDSEESLVDFITMKDEELDPVIKVFMKNLNVSEDQAKTFLIDLRKALVGQT
jgi:hypothetical protein